MVHHEPFKSLGPLSWTADIASRDPSALADLLSATLADAQLLIDSIPSSTTPNPAAKPAATDRGRGRRPRSHTDPSVLLPPSSPGCPRPVVAGDDEGNNKKNAESAQRDRDRDRERERERLARDWKPLKTAANPHGIVMHRLSAGGGGGGAWFARRSVHRYPALAPGGGGGGGGGGFEKWEAALRAEMQATLVRRAKARAKAVGNGEGEGETGNIRGLAAERRVERVDVEGGSMELYQVSVRFPGPTTPRDFVTLLMMPQDNYYYYYNGDGGDGGGDGGGNGKDRRHRRSRRRRRPRQFMIVSRPCEHPACPPRPGFIRGQYESVELIREVPVERPLRRTRSSIDLGRDDLAGVAVRGNGEAALRAAKRAVGEEEEEEEAKVESVGEQSSRAPGRHGDDDDDDDDDDVEMAIEWLMVTRSDPGGSVPRFMVEKGTPGGIINDAGRFLRWMSSQSVEDLAASLRNGADRPRTKPTGESPRGEESGKLPAETAAHDHLPDGDVADEEGDEEDEEPPRPGSSGLYGMIASALGAASSAVASRVAAFAPAPQAANSDDSDDHDYDYDNDDKDNDHDESSTSDASFTSAEEGATASQPDATALANDSRGSNDSVSTHSAPSSTASETPSRAQARHKKELGKLQQRMRKAQEKLERAQARRRAKHGGSTEQQQQQQQEEQEQEDDRELARLRSRHERELAKQQAKHRREEQRLAERRAAAERKAAARRRRAEERTARADARLALERARAERDVARKEADMLRERVGELQAQNTRLVARLGREGLLGGAVGGGGGGGGGRRMTWREP